MNLTCSFCSFQSERHLRSRKSSDAPLDCTLLQTETQFAGNQPEEHMWECEVDTNSERDAGNILNLNINLDEYRDHDIGSIESGSTILHANSAVVSNSKAIVRGDIKFEKNNRRNLASLGDRDVLVVRIQAQDSITSPSSEDLSREVFGIADSTGNTGGINLSSGFAGCSYDKLTFNPTPYNKATNGVYTVSINESVANQKFTDVRNTVLNQLRADFVNNDLNSMFDHVMLCMPPGTVSNSGSPNWAAYGIVNGYVTIYNDNWCTSVSANMHEIGHNLGLRHSNEGTQSYEDKTGLMGSSYMSTTAPKMCFNTAKHHQLGWFSDKGNVVKPLEQNFYQGKLIGFVDYQHSNAPTDASVITKVEGHNVDFFVGFNVKAGINSQNQESDAANKVTVHSVGTSSPMGESDLVAKLGAGESYEIVDFGGHTDTAVIRVDYIDMNANPPVANISINIMKCTSDSDCDDGSLFTTDTCNISTGMCVHTPTNDQSTGTMKMTLLTDRYPGETSWKIVDNCNNDAIVMSGSGYKTRFDTIEVTKELPSSQYTLTIEDTYGDGICCGQGAGSYEITFNDEVVAAGGQFKKNESKTWGSCSSIPNTPSPTSSPTVSPTKSPTSSPTVSPTTSSPTASPSMSPSSSPISQPSSQPSASPTASPTSCETTYDLLLVATDAAIGDASWSFHYDMDTDITVEENLRSYDSNGLYLESGCLPKNCFNFSIKNVEYYELKIDGVSIAKSDTFVSDELSLFGTCQEIGV